MSACFKDDVSEQFLNCRIYRFYVHLHISIPQYCFTMAKIYVASSWKNEYYPEVVKRLEEDGHDVYDFRNPPHGGGGFHWTDVDVDAPNWSLRNTL